MRTGKSDYQIIRVTPTLDTNAYAQGDVLFTATEIPNAVIGKGGCSKLITAYLFDKNDQDIDITFVFTQGNTALGTINATADISDADLLANNICGTSKVDHSETTSSGFIDNSRIAQFINMAGNGDQTSMLLFLQAANDSTSVYVQGIITSASTPTYAADDIQLIFHIEK